MPFEGELVLDILTALANAACWTRAGELRRVLLVDGPGWWSGVESSSEEGDGDGLAFLFPLEERRCMRLVEMVETEVLVEKEWGVANPSVN